MDRRAFLQYSVAAMGMNPPPGPELPDADGNTEKLAPSVQRPHGSCMKPCGSWPTSTPARKASSAPHARKGNLHDQ
jgi:hypothetical protein